MSNSIQMQARLGKDPETRQVGETSVCRLWVAESRKFKDRSGEMQERTNWWSAEVWGKRGEAVQRFFKKGDGIFLRGQLEQSEKDGTRYYSIRVDDWEFPMGGKKGESSGDTGGSNNYQPQSGSDDIPF